MSATLLASLIPRRSIQIPSDYERKENLVEDDALRNSIRITGIQQPIVVLRTGADSFVLIKGYRRLMIAAELGIDLVPAVIDSLPAGEDATRYRDRLRFVLDEHRQDLFPSQRADLIARLKTMFKMTNKEVALYLGINNGTITNWLALLHYAPEIVADIDSGKLNSHAARAFDGMTQEAQLRIYKTHRKDFQTMAGGKLHKMIRAAYPPAKYPDYYRDAATTKKKLAIKKVARAAKKRPAMSVIEKKALSRNLALQETELRDSQADLAQFKREITLATPVIAAILRDKALVAMLTDDQREEFKRFAEVYI